MDQNIQNIGLTRLIQIAADPKLAVLAVLLMASFMLMLINERARWIAIGTVIFLAIPAPMADFFDRWLPPPAPLDTLVLYARSLAAATMAFAALYLMALAVQSNHIRVPVLARWLVVLQALLCIRHMFGGNGNEAIGRLSVYFFVFLGFGFALPSLTQTRPHILQHLRSLLFAGGLYSVCVLYILAMGFHDGFANGRWFGVTGNPNAAGMVGGILAPAAVGLAVWKGHGVAWRATAMTILGVLLFQTLLTGSRGAVLTSVIALVVFFRARLKLMASVGLPVSLLGYGLYRFFASPETDLQRLVDTENTRSHQWSFAIRRWLESPVFGNTSEGFNYVENTYLSVLQHTGIVGGFLMICMIFSAIRLSIRVLRLQKYSGQDGPLFDAALAGLAALGVNGMIEATMFANLAFAIFVMYLYFLILHGICQLYGHADGVHGSLPR